MLYMTINKAYKFRLYPNQKQKELINKTFGCTRLIYDYYLDKKIKEYENNKKNLSCYDCIKDLKNLYNDYPFLKEVDSMSLRCSLFDLDNAYQKFFKEKTGYPKFKSKLKKNSFRTNMVTSEYKGNTYYNIKLDLVNNIITLPKLKNMKIRGYRNIDKINGRIKIATISKELDNTYYVSVLVEEDVYIPRLIPTTIVGLDLGIKDLVITSNYQKYQNEKVIAKYEKRIKQKQKRLAKKEKGSNNYNKLKCEIARIYKRIKNARKYLIHHITKDITRNNDIIVCETLKVKNMVKNHHLAKVIEDASLYEIIRQLEYKIKWKGKKLYKIDTFYPSSQICSHCGYKNTSVKNLNIREYNCPNCNYELDRDVNAAINICFEGLKLYMNEVCAHAKLQKVILNKIKYGSDYRIKRLWSK